MQENIKFYNMTPDDNDHDAKFKAYAESISNKIFLKSIYESKNKNAKAKLNVIIIMNTVMSFSKLLCLFGTVLMYVQQILNSVSWYYYFVPIVLYYIFFHICNSVYDHNLSSLNDVEYRNNVADIYKSYCDIFNINDLPIKDFETQFKKVLL